LHGISRISRNGSDAADFNFDQNRSLKPATGGAAVELSRLRARSAAARVTGGRNRFCGGA
jgi:hypothetical protein